LIVADSSFDIVSKVDRQEVDNAVNQAAKEIAQRYDFKNVGAGIAWSGEAVEMKASTEDRVKAVLDVFQEKLVKRGVSLKALDAGQPQISGKDVKIVARLKQGVSQDNAKKLNKIIKDEGPKGVRTQVQGEEIRVFSKKRDDLQQVIALLKGKDLDFALQFVNYR
jgi:cyclic-di-GMP-binding protein